MPSHRESGQDTSKTDMIAEVLSGDLELPSPEVRARVWERFEAEVTTPEIAQVRKKLRQTQAPEETAKVPAQEPSRKKSGDESATKAEVPAPTKVRPKGKDEAVVATRKKSERRQSEGPPRKKVVPMDFRAKDYVGAEVTVKQLSAILEVAEEVGGLRKLQESLRTVMVLHRKVGDVDEGQLAYALDFLAKLTGKK